jgi:hypothetical protein
MREASRRAAAMRPTCMSPPEKSPVNPSVVGSTVMDQVPASSGHVYVPATLSYCPFWPCVPVHVQPMFVLVSATRVTCVPSSVIDMFSSWFTCQPPDWRSYRQPTNVPSRLVGAKVNRTTCFADADAVYRVVTCRAGCDLVDV